MSALIIRNAEVDGRAGQDVRIEAGRIREVGPRLPSGGAALDARGAALIPGLADHHIHLMATAARAGSVILDDAADAADLAARLHAAAVSAPPDGWVRATGYHERIAGLLSRDDLDRMVSDRPVRVQDRTGGLWMLNSAALARLGNGDAPEGLERDAHGRPTGRLWRGDAWLQARIGRTPPDLATLGAALAAHGVTAATDASVTTDQAAADALADAVRAGDLPMRLLLMSGGPIAAPADGAIRVGPLKVLLDDRDLIPLEDFTARIALARRLRRAVAVHCVTAGELALTLAALDAAGAQAGDRIEHGGVIPAEAIADLRRLRLVVVTQPGFVFERGDRYLAEVDAAEQADLYRCASLIAAGVPVAASSDAPYSAPDPWAAMRAAITRRTRAGRTVAGGERVEPAAALALWLGAPEAPGGPPRRVAPGAAADLCLLKAPLAEALDALTPDLVAATLVDGRLTFEAS